jgi:hypothetical protein
VEQSENWGFGDGKVCTTREGSERNKFNLMYRKLFSVAMLTRPALPIRVHSVTYMLEYLACISPSQSNVKISFKKYVGHCIWTK